MDQVRIGVIGVGNMGSSHCGSIERTERVTMTAVCDIVPEKVKRMAEKYDAKPFGSAEELMQSGLVDAVLIATPHYPHTPLTVAALEAGLHVLVEKPIAVHKADAQIMVDAAGRHPDRVFAAMFQQRTEPAHQKIKQLIEAGELGEIRRVVWVITNWFRSQAYYDSGGWRATWEGEGGGVLLNQCPHQLDMFQWFFGMPSTVRAHCAIGRYHNIEVEDDVTAFCEFPNGATGLFVTSTGETPGVNRLEITGDRGLLRYDKSTLTFLRNEIPTPQWTRETTSGFGRPPVWNIEVPTPGQSTGHQGVIDNFVKAILDGAELIAPATEGIKSVELGNAMLFSSQNNCTVEMPLDAEAYKGMLDELVANSTVDKDVSADATGSSDFDKSFN